VLAIINNQQPNPMLSFPNIDPVVLQIGPLAIRWYSLAYLAGILLGWWYIKSEHKKRPLANLTKKAFDDMVVWAVLGIIIGGRLGYVLFYNAAFYAEHPTQMFHVWEGGMSFHGGMAGVILAFLLFCRKYKIVFLSLMDLIACATPIGLFFGRLANFVNGELYGRVTDAAWGMVFPHGGELPRHPSQLYEAALEGALLFALLTWLLKRTSLRDKPGALSGVFLIGYGLSRILVECFREPDAQLGFLFASATMGQLLSLPMLIIGAYLLWRRTPKIS
jgi:phosphatidylglycerol:prolipoprotein diacylglycerol transferase